MTQSQDAITRAQVEAADDHGPSGDEYVIARENAPDHHEHIGHVVPLPVLGGVLGALLVLTWLTVETSGHPEWGATITISLAMGIATLKAALVAFYFMHLRWDSPVNGFILVVSLVFVALFITISLIDSVSYQRAMEAERLNRPPPATALE